MERLTWEDYNRGCYAQDILQQDYDTATVFTGGPIDRLAAYERTNHTPEECAAAFAELDALKRNPPVQVEAKVLELAMEWSKLKQELDVYRAGDIWKIVCFMIARNNIIESVPKERVDVMALMTIKSMPDMLQMEECRKLLAAAEAALKEQEANDGKQ